jgi:hypothetical protein
VKKAGGKARRKYVREPPIGFDVFMPARFELQLHELPGQKNGATLRPGG